MTNNTKLFSYWMGVACLLVFGHLFLSLGLFSLLPGPLFLALLMSYTSPDSLRGLLLLAVASELFSGLPPGSLTAAIFAPFFLAKIPGRPTADVTVWFFFFIMFTASLQILLLTVGLFFQTRPATLAAWMYETVYFIPSAAPWVIAAVGVASFAAIAVWQEIILPLRPRRTTVRFKPMVR